MEILSLIIAIISLFVGIINLIVAILTVISKISNPSEITKEQYISNLRKTIAIMVICTIVCIIFFCIFFSKRLPESAPDISNNVKATISDSSQSTPENETINSTGTISDSSQFVSETDATYSNEKENNPISSTSDLLSLNSDGEVITGSSQYTPEIITSTISDTGQLVDVDTISTIALPEIESEPTIDIDIVQIDNVINKSYDEAERILKQKGFIIIKNELQHSNASIGEVVEQYPSAGNYAEYGSVITLDVSVGRKCVWVYLDANGGSVYKNMITVEYEGVYSDLPIPERPYYTFEGWSEYVDGGNLIYNGDTVCNSNAHTLYANWKLNEVSDDWVLRSEAPFDAQIVDQKWGYTKTETMESYNGFEYGWDLKESYWYLINSGINKYAYFSPNYDNYEYYNIYDGFYMNYNNNAYFGYETIDTKLEIESEQINSYIFYHWICSSLEYNPEGIDLKGMNLIGMYKNEPIFNESGEYQGTADIWESFESEHTNYDLNNVIFFETEHSTYSYWWYGVIPVYTQTYSEYVKVYCYTRETYMESTTMVTDDYGISNVQEYVKYRIK